MNYPRQLIIGWCASMVSLPQTHSHTWAALPKTLLILTGSRLDLVSEPDFKLAALRFNPHSCLKHRNCEPSPPCCRSQDRDDEARPVTRQVSANGPRCGHRAFIFQALPPACSDLGNPSAHPVFSLPFVVLLLLIILLSRPCLHLVLLPSCLFAFKMPGEKGSGPWTPRF